MANKQILAFGDSLTWGHRPEDGARHEAEDRWPSVLAAGLVDIDVIAEGLRGRTTVYPREEMPADMRGGASLPVLPSTHAPLDLVIIMLGSNDVYIGMSVERIAKGMARLIEIIRSFSYRVDAAMPDILIVAPPVMVEAHDITADMVARSDALHGAYAALADQHRCGFFDAGTVAQSSPLDGVHLDAANTRAIGMGLVPIVQARLRNR